MISRYSMGSSETNHPSGRVIRLQAEASMDEPLPAAPGVSSALRKWAEEHGVSDCLTHKADRLRPWLSNHVYHLMPNYSRRCSVRDCMLGNGLEPNSQLKGFSGQLLQAARGYLHYRAVRKRQARRRSALWARRVQPERLQTLASRLKERLTALRKRPDFDEPVFYTSAAMELAERPLSIAIRFQDTQQSWTSEAVVRLQLDPAGQGDPTLACSCTHATSGACRHQRLLLECTLDILCDASHPSHRILVDFLLVPGWQRFLDGLQDAVRSADERCDPPDRELAWRLGADEHVGFSVSPVIRKRLKNGHFGRGRKVSLDDALGDQALISEQDQRVLQALSFGDRIGGPSGDRRVRSIAQAIQALVDHPKVFLESAPGRPLKVTSARPVLEITAVADGFQLALWLGPQRMQSPALGTHLLGDRHLVFLDEQAAECYLAVLNRTGRDLVQLLSHYPVTVPTHQADALLALAMQTQPELVLDVPPVLQGDVVPAATTPQLRLAPIGDHGLDVSFVVRPAGSRSSAAWTPGAGPRQVFTTAAGRRVSTTRDLEGERRSAAARQQGLGLPPSDPADPWHWRLGEPEAALDLLQTAADMAGELRVEWPEGQKPWQARTVSPENVRVKVYRSQNWFRLDGEAEVDGARIGLLELLAAVRQGERFVRIGPQTFVRIAETLQRSLESIDECLMADGRKGMAVSLACIEQLDDGLQAVGHFDCDREWRKLGERVAAAAKVTPKLPKGLRASLRSYQREGFFWLARLSAWDAGACLADDMGLGKTLQGLAILLHRATRGPALVVAPTSVEPVWLAEAERYAPGLRMLHYRGPNRRAKLDELGPGRVLVTSYDILTLDVDELGRISFASLVLDEAQAIKNARAQRTKAASRVQADFRLALTGTPLENHLGELWSIFHVVNPGLLGPWTHFHNRFAAPIERDKDKKERLALSKLLRPFLLRRTKAQVAPELPPRTEVIRPVELSAAERQLYLAAQTEAIEALAQFDGSSEQQRFALFAAITRLRQLACHPRLLNPGSPVTSSKLACAVELIERIRTQRQRALIFSQFTKHLALLREALDARGADYLYLDGSTPLALRADLVRRWAEQKAELFLISLKAGGFGLNLSGADFVLHLDPWWNPAVEDQASDRTHRIGQTKPVTVVRLIAQSTIEEAVIALHDEKRELAQSLLEGADGAARLSSEELVTLIRFGDPSSGLLAGEEKTGFS